MTISVFTAVQCRLMADVAAWMRYQGHSMFWETLPGIVPDLAAHLPSLVSAVSGRAKLDVLNMLSSYPLPAVLSPKDMGWRMKLITAWEERLKAAREVVDGNRGDWEWEYEYRSSLRGLTHVDGCGVPPGMTCPSVLPTLLNEVRDIQKRFRRMTTEMASTVSFGSLYEQHLECLAAVAGWRPAPNVLTDPADLKAWGEFWLELYQSGEMTATDRKPDDAIIRKGIGAKALLNLLEMNDKTGVPAGMETLLLESLTKAADVAGNIPRNNYSLGWLSWQPQDVTRFPTDQLATFPKALLEKVRLLCQEPDGWVNKTLRNTLSAALEELVRWNRAGLLADCGIDLFPHVVAHVSYYLDNCIGKNIPSAHFLDHKLYKWVGQPEVATVEGGRELLQKLENHWQSECISESSRWDSRIIAWKGRMQLQQSGIATETPSTFQKNLLEAIKNEKSQDIRLVLSLWSPGKDMPNRGRRAWERWWEEGLKSDDKVISQAAALILLRPNPNDSPVARQQKLRDVLCALPEERRPKLSVAELTHLMGEMPLGEWDMDARRSWQFGPGGIRHHSPMERTTPSLGRMTAQPAMPDRAAQRTAVYGRPPIAPTTRHDQSRT